MKIVKNGRDERRLNKKAKQKILLISMMILLFIGLLLPGVAFAADQKDEEVMTVTTRILLLMKTPI